MKNLLYIKNYLLFISLLFLLPLITHAQGTACNSGQDITLTTQAAVDNFVATYGTCNNVNNLTIRGADITNVDSLYNIQFIGNTLSVQNLANLENLDGLGNLSSIFGNLVVGNCPKITNLDAFANLGRLVNEVRISNMANLTSIASLQNITPPSTPANAPPIRFVRIFDNPKLAACCDLYDIVAHPNVETVIMYGNAGNCTKNGITADPADATINVAQNGGVIESGIICPGTPAQLQAPNIFTYQWAADPSLSATDIANPTITPTANTTYSVTITGCNNQVANKSVTVMPLDIDRVYVKPDATGNNDGTTWEHAFTELQPAINRACEGSEIWVAAGTYQPTEIPYTTGTGNRLKTFHLSKNVQLYGGFAGTETQLSARNPAINKTILDANGRYHTLIAANLSEAAIIDGFTIQNANGNSSTAHTYAGVGFFHTNAGGVFLRNSDLQIRNCIFTNNRSDAGSGVMIQGTSKPTITNCLFFGNPNAHAIYTFRSSAPKIINCTITNNASGIFNRNETATPQYINTIIYGNNTNVTITEDCVPTFKNCLVEDSGGSNWSIEGATDLGGNIDADPLFVSATDFSLIECSPAINAGDNTANTTTKDLAGNPRVFNSSMIDLGAYEWQAAITPLPIQIVYVNVAANGANDGTSWTNAFNNLQDALAINKENCVAYQIWVAAGTYYPDEGVGQTDNDRNASFAMHNNVAIYGGLVGNEPANFDLNQRNIAANTTILSGDIDQNDQTAGGNTANSHHIISNNNNRLEATAVLDGFTITAGYSEDSDGAGIYNLNASPTFRNCTIAKNTAKNGGGNYNDRSFSTWLNCVFVGNLATQQGGGMYNYNASHPRLINCTMEGNQSSGVGYAIRNFLQSNSDLTSFSTLTNCILWNNVQVGGDNSFRTVWGRVTAINSLIQEENGFLDGRDYNNDPLFVQETNFANPSVVPDLRLQICSPLRNRGRNDADIDGTIGSQTIADIATDVTGNARVFDGTIDLGAYEMQAIPNGATYTGDIIYVNAAVVGGAKNGTSWQNAYPTLQDALTQTCLSAATQIWVAKGTYYPDEGGGKVNNDRQARFVMQNGLKIIGGLVGNESPDYDLNNRNLVANKTILSGNIDQNVEDYTGLQFSGIDHNSFYLFDHNRTGLDNTAVLDGFTLTAANSPNQGAGMRNMGSSPTIKNCVFANNTSGSQGGGLYFEDSDVTVANCDFLNNRGEAGVGIYSEDSNLNVNNCTFVNNIGANRFGANGAGIYHRGSGSLNCTNSLFTGNRVLLNALVVFDLQEDNDSNRKSAKGEKRLGGSSVGGAIYAVGSQPMKFINCTIEGNEAVQGGGGIFFNSNLSLINTIVWNNKGETDIGSATANVFTFSSIEIMANHSLIQGNNPTGTGNFDGTDSSIDPLFVSESKFVSGTTNITNGDLRLQRCSPLLNKGDNDANRQTIDVADNPRIFDAVNSGIIDLGVYELQDKPFSSLMASASPATCVGETNTANSDGKITIANFTSSDKYQYSTGSSFNASAAIPSNPATIPTNGEIANNLANANQSYTVRITNGNGCTVDRIVSLTLTTCTCTTSELANIPNQAICLGENFSTVSTSVTNSVSVTYQWYNNSGTNNNNTNAISGQTAANLTVLPTAAGTYNYRVEATRTDDATCKTSKTVTLTINALPTATAMATPSTCQAGTSTAKNDGKITIFNFAAADKYQYSTGSTFNASAAIPSSPTTIPSSGIIVNTLTNANQSYTVRITNTNGCTIDRTVNLTLTNCSCTAPVLANVANQTICIGETFTAVSTSVTNSVAVTYQWYNNNGTNNNNANTISGQTAASLTALPTAAGTNQYRVEATRTDDATCKTSKTVILTINTLPTATLTSSDADNSICAGESVTFTASGGTTYKFFKNGTAIQSGSTANFSSSTFSNNDKIKVEVTNANGCKATSAEITMTVNALPTASITSSDADNSICVGENVIFTASGGTNYQFFKNNSSVQNGTTATYSSSTLANNDKIKVEVTNASGCKAASAEITMAVKALPTVNLTSSDADNSINMGESVTFTATGGTSYNFMVNNSSVQNSTQNTYTTTTLANNVQVKVEVTNANNCKATSNTITMTVIGTNGSTEAGPNQSNVCGLMVQLAAQAPTIGSGQWTASPSGGSFVDATKSNTQFTGKAGVTYTLTWTVPGASDQVQISFNGDADNDTVQDCIDLCPGGDDRINTDGAGMPDACDCDANDARDETVNLPGNIITKTDLDAGLYQSSLALSSTARINPNKTVAFKAGNQITLDIGFHAQLGSNFTAEIEYCNFLNNSLVEEETTELRNIIQEALAGKGGKISPTIGTKIETNETVEIGFKVSPNPFREKMTAFVNLPKATTASLMVFDAQGQLIKMVLHKAAMPAGQYELPIIDAQLSTGIYYIHLRTQEGSVVQKVIGIR